MIGRVKGVVVEGKRLGRELGFPTANIIIREDLSIPNGVYSSQVVVDGHTYAAISNVGNNPTLGGEMRRVESYIFDFKGNIYGCEIEVELSNYIREEQKFDSVESLQSQIARDIERIKAGR